MRELAPAVLGRGLEKREQVEDLGEHDPDRRLFLVEVWKSGSKLPHSKVNALHPQGKLHAPGTLIRFMLNTWPPSTSTFHTSTRNPADIASDPDT